MQQKVTLKSKGTFLAEGQLEDGTIVRFSRTNSTWYEYNLASRAVGDSFTVETQVYQGSTIVERLRSENYVKVLDIENKILQRSILSKQEASL